MLAATYKESELPEYNNTPLTWKCHKDAGRVDGFCQCWFLISIYHLARLHRESQVLKQDHNNMMYEMEWNRRLRIFWPGTKTEKRLNKVFENGHVHLIIIHITERYWKHFKMRYNLNSSLVKMRYKSGYGSSLVIVNSSIRLY